LERRTTPNKSMLEIYLTRKSRVYLPYVSHHPCEDKPSRICQFRQGTMTGCWRLVVERACSSKGRTSISRRHNLNKSVSLCRYNAIAVVQHQMVASLWCECRSMRLRPQTRDESGDKPFLYAIQGLSFAPRIDYGVIELTIQHFHMPART
jgi:hypothetical protein